MDRSSPPERLGRGGSGGGVSIRSKAEWRLGKGKWALLCSRFFRALIFLNTEHLNHMFGNIRESSGKHQPFHFYFQRAVGVGWGRRGWGEGQEGREEVSSEGKPEGSARSGSLAPRRAPPLE